MTNTILQAQPCIQRARWEMHLSEYCLQLEQGAQLLFRSLLSNQGANKNHWANNSFPSIYHHCSLTGALVFGEWNQLINKLIATWFSFSSKPPCHSFPWRKCRSPTTSASLALVTTGSQSLSLPLDGELSSATAAQPHMLQLGWEGENYYCRVSLSGYTSPLSVHVAEKNHHTRVEATPAQKLNSTHQNSLYGIF